MTTENYWVALTPEDVIRNHAWPFFSRMEAERFRESRSDMAYHKIFQVVTSIEEVS